MAATPSEIREMKQKCDYDLVRATDPLEKLRLQCLIRGVTGIRNIGRMFRIIDDNGSKSVDMNEFEKGLHDYGVVRLNHDEIKQLFTRFDKDGSGTISFNEFLENLRPPMSERRKRMINKAFNKLDTTGDGVVTVQDLKGIYDVKKHPKYLNGEWTEDQIRHSFLENFEDAKSKDGKITREEFINYYSGVSASVDSDAYFELMMSNAYKL